MRQYNGTIIWVENYSRTVRDAEGGILYYEGSLIDVTKRKKLEAQWQHAQRMESIGTLAGGIAHDFNNLMMGIQGNISLLLFDIDSSFPHYKKLKNIEESIKSGARLTSQLLGYARKGKYEARRLVLNQIIDESAETFGRTRKEITINRRFESDLSEIEADRTQIEQILFNLFINAADAMPGGGDLTLKTTNINSQDMTDKQYKPVAANYVMLQVTDTGEGMDTKTLERIFDPFFTTKGLGRGTGLGLASVYGIIKAHGGYIDVDSEQGVGTTFHIYFPAIDKSNIHSHIPHKGPNRIKPGKGTILMVDDEEIIIDVSIEMLEKIGYRVLKALSGKEAISEYQASSAKIDLVILDLIMPKISGSEVYDKLKEINPQVKVLLSSGYSVDGQATEILKRGCNGFIQKPFNMEELSRKVNEILDSK